MRLFATIILLLGFFVLHAQKELQYDSSSIERRAFNGAGISQYKNNKEFRYENIKEPPQSLWDRFWRWFWFKVHEILSTKAGRATMWTTLIVFAVGMVVFTVSKITGSKRESLFARASGDGSDYSVSSEDIHTISFDEAINEAASVGDYRRAVRLLYLQTLKKLADKGLIDWKINKTNTDYIKEVSQQTWSSLFSSLTHSFDYAWYGEMTLNKEKFDEVNEEFKTFNNQL